MLQILFFFPRANLPDSNPTSIVLNSTLLPHKFRLKLQLKPIFVFNHRIEKRILRLLIIELVRTKKKIRENIKLIIEWTNKHRFPGKRISYLNFVLNWCLSFLFSFHKIGCLLSQIKRKIDFDCLSNSFWEKCWYGCKKCLVDGEKKVLNVFIMMFLLK